MNLKPTYMKHRKLLILALLALTAVTGAFATTKKRQKMFGTIYYASGSAGLFVWSVFPPIWSDCYSTSQNVFCTIYYYGNGTPINNSLPPIGTYSTPDLNNSINESIF
jgi:hypothetical protein